MEHTLPIYESQQVLKVISYDESKQAYLCFCSDQATRLVPKEAFTFDPLAPAPVETPAPEAPKEDGSGDASNASTESSDGAGEQTTPAPVETPAPANADEEQITPSN